MNKEILQSELQFKAVRSSRAGGQNVNKVSSKVELTFNLEVSSGLSDDEKDLLKQSIVNRLTKENMLLLQCDESRSQHKNKE
ncbi:MAG: peptide chain release factor-like protein, partial [Aquaticitalea sp.]